ncbi:MAG: hypothetical protein EHM28_03955 [Spirochaetaceae bacterium]|nr:MAG: hypothetical protein EHM28_03955 [Spirochaetaceae bacterium]
MMFSLNVKDLFLILFFLSALFPLVAVEPEKREIALCSIFSGQYELQAGALEAVDSGIGSAVVSASRYNVQRIGISLKKEDLAELLDLFEKARGNSENIPETIRFGEREFEKGLFLKLLGSVYIMVPVISQIKEESEMREGQERFKVTVHTDFYIAQTADMKIIAEKSVQTMGYDRDKARALEDALNNIPPLLAYEIGQVKELKIGTVILGVSGDEVIIEHGSQGGAFIGGEYVIRGSEILPSGQIISHDKALIMVTEVTEKVSIGQVRYQAGPLVVGDSVEELPRIGLELSPYSVTLIPLTEDQELTSYVGLRLTLARWLTGMRPLFDVEFQVYPLETYQEWFPVRLHAGVELRLYFGPVEFAAIPSVGIEERISVTAENDSTFVGFGLRGIVEFSILVSRDLKILLNGGYEYWFGARQGILAAGGISIKL